MKMFKYYVVVIVISFFSAAFASVNGTPDEDPIVKNLAEEFIRGLTPTEADLKIKWDNCTEYVAASKNLKKMTRVRFEFYDRSNNIYNIYRNIGMGETKDQNFTLWEDELYVQKNINKRPYYNTIRISPKSGNLISEWSCQCTTGCEVDILSGGGNPTYTANGPSARDKNAKVISYTECIKP